MICHKCGGRMENQTVRFCACEANPPLFVDNTPAFVCRQCGERVYSDETMEALERILQGQVTARGVQFVASYQFADLVDNSVSAFRMAPLTGVGMVVTFAGAASGMTIVRGST